MQRQVLQQELFQLSERIKQTDYKIAKQTDPVSRAQLKAKRDRYAKTRQNIKMLLRVVYENQLKKQCTVA